MLIALDSTPVIPFFLVDANGNPVISQSPTIKILTPGDTAYATITPTVTEDTTDLGTYWFTLTGTYTDTEGYVMLVITGGGATWRDRFQVVGTDFLPAETMNQIADHVLRRYSENVEGSSDGDDNTGTPYYKSLLGVIAKNTHKNAMSGANRNVYESDDTTIWATETGTTATAGDPIVATVSNID